MSSQSACSTITGGEKVIMSKEKKELVFEDQVWNRVVQIIQEGMLMGTDVTDLLRQIRVEVGPKGDLVLTETYRTQVVEGYDRMVKEAERLKAEHAAKGIPIKVGIIKDDPTDGTPS